MDLASALELGDRELVSFVGAGGKKTSMGSLTDQATGIYRVGYTTTTHMPPPEAYPIVIEGTAEIEAGIEAAVTPSKPIAFAQERVTNPQRVDAKVKGFDPETIDSIYDSGRLDWILVKADGARMREFKAPGEGEPAIPSASTVVVPVASAKIIEAELTAETVHRPERVAEITGTEMGATLTPERVGQVIAADTGGLKHVPSDARVVPIINKADEEAERRAARQALESAFERTDRFDGGLVTSFEADFLEKLRP